MIRREDAQFEFGAGGGVGRVGRRQKDSAAGCAVAPDTFGIESYAVGKIFYDSLSGVKFCLNNSFAKLTK